MPRVALVGCGNIGMAGHFPVYAQIAEAELVAVCDIVEERVINVGKRLEVDIYTEYNEGSYGVSLLDECDYSHAI